MAHEFNLQVFLNDDDFKKLEYYQKKLNDEIEKFCGDDAEPVTLEVVLINMLFCGLHKFEV